MSETNTCPECGGSLPPDAPGGACPRCLLAAGLDDEAPAGGADDLELEPDGTEDSEP